MSESLDDLARALAVPMPRRRVVRICFAAAALVCITGPVASGSAAESRSATAKCPAAVERAPTGTDVDGLLKAIRRDIPTTKAFAMTNQAGPIHLTPKTYEVVATIALSRMSPSLGDMVTKYRGIAAKHCGAGLAKASWVVLLNFPTAGSVLDSRGVAFFAPTKAGWALWYAYD